MSVGVAQYLFSRTAVGRHFFAVLGSFMLQRIALDDSTIEAHVQHQSKSEKSSIGSHLRCMNAKAKSTLPFGGPNLR